MFPAVIKAGRRLSSPHFTAVVSEEAKGYAVVVSKKVARLSVTRHRVKRKLFVALRTLKFPYALILFPKASACSMDYWSIKIELAELLSKIHQ